MGVVRWGQKNFGHPEPRKFINLKRKEWRGGRGGRGIRKRSGLRNDDGAHMQYSSSSSSSSSKSTHTKYVPTPPPAPLVRGSDTLA